jgi:Zn-dependent alcohol dehydrogenase
VVFGTGSVGMSAVMAARVAGCATIIGSTSDPTVSMWPASWAPRIRSTQKLFVPGRV